MPTSGLVFYKAQRKMKLLPQVATKQQMGDTLINIIYYLELNQHDKDFPKVLKSKAIRNTFYQILMFRFKKKLSQGFKRSYVLYF